LIENGYEAGIFDLEAIARRADTSKETLLEFYDQLPTADLYTRVLRSSPSSSS